MKSRTSLLLGILIGQLLMLPYIKHLINTPRIEALTISDKYFNHNETIHLQIMHLHNKYHFGGDTLNIYLASEFIVNREYQREFNDSTPVEGFYNVLTNTIWCVYDPLVLHHEIRHVTEGAYHR
jgi:hypothetical protein